MLHNIRKYYVHMYVYLESHNVLPCSSVNTPATLPTSSPTQVDFTYPQTQSHPNKLYLSLFTFCIF